MAYKTKKEALRTVLRMVLRMVLRIIGRDCYKTQEEPGELSPGSWDRLCDFTQIFNAVQCVEFVQYIRVASLSCQVYGKD